MRVQPFYEHIDADALVMLLEHSNNIELFVDVMTMINDYLDEENDVHVGYHPT